jgi:hypothetical protein
MRIFLVFIMAITLAEAKQRKIEVDKLELGEGSGNTSILFKNGSNQQIRSNPTSGKLEVSHDGSIFKAVGSGSGGGGGENFNNAFSDDDNPGAENGTSGWTSSAGTFVASSSDPVEGDNSFTWTANAQNDYVESSALNFNRDIFKGRACEARVEYIGGDENLNLQVVDSGGDIIAQETLESHSIFGAESVFFVCPTGAAITANADLASLKYRITNTGASVAVQIKWDKSYMGTLRGLTEMTTNDTLTAKVNSSGGIDEDDEGALSSCSKLGVGDYRCLLSGVFNSGFPHIQATVSMNSGNDRIIQTFLESSNQFRVQCENNAGTFADCNFFLSITKRGTDAKQSVQVYKSIPKVSENVNSFSALVQAGGTVTTSNVDWLLDCRDAGVGRIVCDFNPGTFSVVPTCGCTPDFNTSGDASCQIVDITASAFLVQNNLNGAVANSPSHVSCSKQGADFKLPTVQPIVIGGVQNSYSKNSSLSQTRSEFCRVTNSGTPSASSVTCQSWVGSITDNGVGDTTLTFSAGMFSGTPVCVVTSETNAAQARIASIRSISSTAVRIYVTNNSESAVDNNFHINCSGI